MKVAYYTDQLYKYGGIEQVISNKLEYLSRKTDYELYLLTFEQKARSFRYPIVEQIMADDLAINYNRKKSYWHPSNLIKAPVHYLRLKRWLKQRQPDILVVCHYSFDFYFLPFIRSKGKPMIVKEYHSSKHYSAQENESGSFVKRMLNRVNRYIESRYDYLVVLTEDERNYYTSDNVVVIPNALSTVPEWSARLDNKKVISAGRVAPVKGFERLIEAWKTVNQRHPDWKLEIFGDGEPTYMAALQERIKSLGLQHSVYLKGSTSVMLEEMRKAAIYAMTSKTECFPMVLLETLSCGIPVVSFDCPNGPRNIITQEEDGYLVADQDVKAMARSLIRLIEDPELRVKMGSKGKENIQRFLPERVMVKWINLFNKSMNYAV